MSKEIEAVTGGARRGFAGRLGIMVATVAALVGVPASAFATTSSAATVSSVFTGLQTLFTGSLVPAVVLFFAGKIALVMATTWAGHIATSRKG